MKKLLTLLLSAVMVLAMMPGMAFADSTDNKTDESVAKVGGKYYANLQEAMDVGGDVVLLKDVALTSQLNITTKAVLDGQGFTISVDNDTNWSTQNQSKHLVDIYASAEIKNTNFDCGKKAYGVQAYDSDEDKFTATFENVTVTNSKGAGMQANGANVILRNVKISNNGVLCPDIDITAGSNVIKSGEVIIGENCEFSSMFPIRDENKTVSTPVKGENGVLVNTEPLGMGELGEFKVFTNKPEAKIGEEVYFTFGDALTAVDSSDEMKEVELLRDIEVKSEIKLDKPVTITGNDHTITVNHDKTGNTGSAGILVTADGTVIQNVKVVGPNKTAEDGNPDTWKSGQAVIKVYSANEETPINVTLKDIELSSGSYAVQANGANVTIQGEQNFHGNTYNGVEVSNGGKLTMDDSAMFIVPEDYDGSVVWKDSKEAGTIETNGTIAQSINEAKEDEHRYVAQPPAISTSDGGYYLTAEDAVAYMGDNADITVLKDGTKITEALANKAGTITVPENTTIVNNTGDKLEVVTSDGTKVTVGEGNVTVTKPAPPTGGGSYDPLATAKSEAIKAVEDFVKLADYDTAEQAVIKDILAKAKNDINSAKTKEDIKTIEDAVKAELGKVLTIAEKEEAEQVAKDAKIKAGVEGTTIKLTSELVNGKIKLNWTKSKGYKVDYYEVYKSLNQFKGYGTKPYYETKDGSKTWYKNTKELKKGTRYYYKVRGVRVINGEKVYTQYSTKAWRLVK